MPAGEAAEPAEWVTPGAALGALLKAGRGPDQARIAIFRGLQSGAFVGRADRIVTEYTDGTTEHLDHEVLSDVWRMCPLPPFGHRFWSSGDIQIRPSRLPDGSIVTVGGQRHELPFGYQPPVVTVTGFRIPLHAVIELGGVFHRSVGRGRRKGIGGFAKVDEPLIQEMRALLQDGVVSSAHAAAVEVAPKAVGGGQQEAKVKRLTKRYKAAFPDAP